MKIGEVVGYVSSGERQLAMGQAAVKIIIPSRVAPTIIGPGGRTQQIIRAKTGVSIRVDHYPIPCGSTTEQGACLFGPLSGIQASLGQVLTEMAKFIHEPWFA